MIIIQMTEKDYEEHLAMCKKDNIKPMDKDLFMKPHLYDLIK